MPQPTLSSNQGVLLTVGFVSGADRWEIVQPVSTDEPSATATNLCKHATDDWNAGPAADLLAGISSSTSLVWVQAEGMVDGAVPNRIDYNVGARPGDMGASLMPTSCAALLIYYVDPASLEIAARMRSAKTFVSGLDSDLVDGDILDPTVVTALAAYAGNMANGYGWVGGTKNWYRVGAAKRAADTTLENVGVYLVRHYIGTQRRRMVPH